jgi:hypothetical protein
MECVFVFKFGPPFTGVYKIYPSGDTDIDIARENILDKFAEFSYVKVKVWGKFDCQNSELVYRKTLEKLVDQHCVVEQNFIKCTIENIKEKIKLSICEVIDE